MMRGAGMRIVTGRDLRRGAGLVFLLLLGTSCGRDLDIGRRYQTERELWRTDWEFRNLAIRPQDVSEAQWAALAQRYEGIAERIMQVQTSTQQTEIRDEVQSLAARALFAAARVHAQLRDSIRVEQLFGRMAQDFGHLPQVATEVALAQASIAESKGQLREAADFYQSVVERVEPQPGAAGAAGMVLDLPLRIARLRAQEQGADREEARVHFGLARAYYEQLIGRHEGDLIRIEAQDRLALLSADLGDWDTALRSMRDLEAQVLTMDRPPREPCEIRFAIAGLERRAGKDPAEVRRTLESVLTDYPKCKVAPQVLLALADNANQRNQVEEALGHLDRIIREFRTDEDAAPQALLFRGRLLASRDRWPEALEIYRTLPGQHPLSEPALLAPLEIAQHYHQAGDERAATAALEQAERGYRDFVAKYPPGRHTVSARQHLIQALLLQEKYEPAIDEYVSLGDDLKDTPQGASLMLAAARVARDALADPSRAAGILDHVAEVYSQADIGRWAASEAARLREAPSQP